MENNNNEKEKLKVRLDEKDEDINYINSKINFILEEKNELHIKINNITYENNQLEKNIIQINNLSISKIYIYILYNN